MLPCFRFGCSTRLVSSVRRARIIFVADAFDAMTSDRVYQSRLSTEEALAELERCAGTQFDPELVAALVEEVAAQPPSAVLAS